VLLPLTAPEAREPAPPRFAGATALAHAGITDADLPAGWRVQQTAMRPPWPSEAEARAVWSVAFSAADGRRRGAERVIAFPSSRQAERWLTQARDRAPARGAHVSPCHYHAGGATSATVRTTPDGALIEQVLLRQRSLVLRLMFSSPAADRSGAPCTDAAQAIVMRASQRAVAFLTQRQAVLDIRAPTDAGVLADALAGTRVCWGHPAGAQAEEVSTMGFLSKLFGRRPAAAPPAADVPPCPHVTLVPRWNSAAEMGDEAKASGYQCDSCQQTFTAEEGRALRQTEAARVAQLTKVDG